MTISPITYASSPFSFRMPIALSASPAETEKAIRILKEQGVEAYLIGEIIESEEKISIV